MKLVIALLAVMFLASVANADSGGTDLTTLVIQVNGAFTAQGEAFAVSYEAVLCCSNPTAENYNLVPGTLSYSLSGPLGTVTSVGGIFPEGAEWQLSGGDVIELLLFRTPGCGAPGVECQPEVGPDEYFPPGTNVNAFANGIFEIFQPGQDGNAYYNDVQVTVVPTPEPSTYAMMLAGIMALVGLKWYRTAHGQSSQR